MYVTLLRDLIARSTTPLLLLSTPPVLLHLRNCESLIDIAVQHRLDQINIPIGHDPRDPQLVVKDLIDAVKGVFLIDEGVEQYTQGPDILFLTAVGFALEDFRSCII